MAHEFDLELAVYLLIAFVLGVMFVSYKQKKAEGFAFANPCLSVCAVCKNEGLTPEGCQKRFPNNYYCPTCMPPKTTTTYTGAF
jgi:hypothetical protein